MDDDDDEEEEEVEEEPCRCKRWDSKIGEIFSARCITRAMNDPDEPLNSVSKIDRLSR